MLTGLRIVVAFACLLACAPARAQPAPAEAPSIALLRAPPAVKLADVLAGRTPAAFEPIVTDRVTLRARPEITVWLRLRTTLPPDGQAYFVRIDRQAIDRARLYLQRDPDHAVAIADAAAPGVEGKGDDAVLLAIPRDTVGAQTMYVELRARGLLYLQPQVLREDEVLAREDASASLDRWVNLLLGLVAIFGIVRRLRQPASATLPLTFAAIAVGLGCLATNGELGRIPGGAVLLLPGPQVVPALWLLACAPLLWSTNVYAGMAKHLPWFGTVLSWAAGVFLVLGLAAFATPPAWLAWVQLGGLAGLAVTGAIAVLALLADPRQSRWPAIIIWAGVIAAVLAQVMIHAQALTPTLIAWRGFQLMLALLLAVYLAVPWLREIVRERVRHKRTAPELTTEEMIGKARDQLLASLHSGLANAAEGDMEWIAYRRLLEGLKPVLPQLASAVVAMNYHHNDLLLVEPRDAEGRYRQLLLQRGQLLRNLSRSRAPQQVSLDFDGPAGPLPHVQFAVIPLPIPRPGWGALLVERDASVVYSDGELDLCAEFAALATTAGDEAAEAMETRRANEYDAQSGVYRREVVEKLLKQALEASSAQRTPLAVMRVGLEGNLSTIATLAEVVRDEIHFGDCVGRFGDSELLVVLPERTVVAAREIAERMQSAARKSGLAVGIGISATQPQERAVADVLDRAAKALVKSRASGGQVQVVLAP